LGRSVLDVANALAELDAAGVALYCDQQGIDSTTPMGRAMIQMASVFGTGTFRSSANESAPVSSASVRRLGRPTPKVEDAIRAHLRANGILKVARLAYSGGHFADVRAAVFAPKNTLRT
jgi:hypothetical protein